MENCIFPRNIQNFITLLCKISDEHTLKMILKYWCHQIGLYLFSVFEVNALGNSLTHMERNEISIYQNNATPDCITLLVVWQHTFFM